MSPLQKIFRCSPTIGLLILLAFITLTPALPRNARAQDSTLPKIESDAPAVLQEGTWVNQPAPPASGGSYLYNSGEAALALQFAGPSLEIIYVAGPSLGTLAIEVDGVVLRTVITTDSEVYYQQAAKIDYLTDEHHTLRVYAQAGGVIGLDAFIAQLAVPLEIVTTGIEPNAQSRYPCQPNSFPQLVSRQSDGSLLSGGGGIPAPYEAALDISADGRYVLFNITTGNLFNGTMAAHLYLYDRLACNLTLLYEENGPMGLRAAISGNGRYMVFESSVATLVPNDTNNGSDIFMLDLITATTTRVSLTNEGTEANGWSQWANISNDGRFIVFLSAASNLVANDTNSISDVFVRDTQALTTTRVSVGLGSFLDNNGFKDSPDISADGRMVVFGASASIDPDHTQFISEVFVHDRITGITTQVSASPNPADVGTAWGAHLAANGRYVLFESNKQYLVPNDTNNRSDIFLRDLQTGAFTLVSVTPTGETRMREAPTAISGDGRYISFVGDYNANDNDPYGSIWDIFMHDRQTGQTYIISARNLHLGGNRTSPVAVMADNAPVVAFESYASNILDLAQNTDYKFFVTSVNPPPLPVNGDKLALINSASNQVSLIGTVAEVPPPSTYLTYTPNARAGGQWVMGDWDGDGDSTLGVYEASGAFMFTNDSRPSASWRGVWFGLFGHPPVVGRFDGNESHDCLGVVDSAEFPSFGAGYAAYFTCNLTSGPTPPLQVQWLGVPFRDDPTQHGPVQFGAGHFGQYGPVDVFAIRRDNWVMWIESYSSLTFIGVAISGINFPANDSGRFVVGDWDDDGYDSFGFVLENGDFYWRNDLWLHWGQLFSQHTGLPVGTPIQAASWR